MVGFVRVAPLCRTPVGVEAFDYRAPSDIKLLPGDLIHVPLRNRRVEAVVLETLNDSPFAAKARTLENTPPLTRFGTDWVRLLQWLSARTFQSAPSILKAWLRALPKKLHPWNTLIPTRTNPTIATHWTAHPEQELIAHVQSLSPHERVLIIAPYTHQAERLASALHTETLLSNDPKTTATNTWQAFTEGATTRLCTTRVGAWLGAFAEHVILLEPENDEHKQDELSPRFDARLITAWLHQRLGADVATFGRTPPLHVQTTAPTLDLHPQLFIKHGQGSSNIPGIAFDALEAFLEGEATLPRTIIHPIRGMRARVQCRECGEIVSCRKCGSALRRREQDGWCDICHLSHAIPEQCERCGGVQFSGSSAGIELLKKRWQISEYPEVKWRDGSPLAIDTPFAKGSRVLVTQPSLLGGAAEDVRRSERLCRTYRTLAARVLEAEGTLLLQVPETDTNRWLNWLTPTGVESFFLQERADRRTFRYPPSVRLVKLLVNGGETAADTLVTHLRRALQSPQLLETRGPFLAEGRPLARPRFVLHLLFAPETPEETLLQLLRPFANRAVIDLDPIAFLR